MAEYVKVQSMRTCFARPGRALLLAACALPLLAAEPPVTEKDLPRFSPVESADVLKTFQVKKGFHLELAASEPNVVSPVALSFDERGRMFVAEMIDYSERRDEVPHLGRIRMLEDTKGDGVFDKSTVYADNLPWPTAVFCYDGGVFVGATPDILYLKDTKGDGKADVREVVFTGFSEGMQRLNVQELLNSFVWGLDNRIHGATSGSGGLIKSLRHPETKPIDLRGRDFSIDPRAMTMTSEAGGGQHGLSFDDYGRRFTCNNSDHLRLFMYDDRYAARNPFYAMPAPLADIAMDGPAAEVYRISPEEPWRVIRTRWRIAGLVSGPVEGGGRSSGYFTGATGITIYRGDAFLEEFRGNAFVADVAFNLIHRKILYPDGAGLKAQRPADEANVEFAASRDTWFRPVQFANAPEGTLYVIDMYREIVEHPWSLPESIKKFLDLNSGSNRGRIYRIVPDGFKPPQRLRLDQATTKELVAALEHPNGWHRDTASRLLYERQDPAAVPLLEKLLEKSKSSLARVHALHALDGLNALREKHVLRALGDSDPEVREHAIKLSEKFALNSRPNAPLFKKLKQLVSDPAIGARYQLAFTLGEFFDGEKFKALAEIAQRDSESPWMQAAILSSLSNGVAEVFADLAPDRKYCGTKSGREFLRQLSSLVGAKNEPKEVSQVIAFIARNDDPALSFSLLRTLGNGLQRAGGSLRQVEAGETVKSLLAQAAKAAWDNQAGEGTRVEAIQLLGLAGYDESGAALFSLLAPQQPQTIQLSALAALSRFAGPRVPDELTRRWGDFKPRVKSEALSILLARPERAAVLLQAIQNGVIQPSDLTTAQIKFLRNHGDQGLRESALKILGPATLNKRQEVIDAYQAALNLPGDAARGRQIYLERCSSCHRLGGQGFALGPDLVTVKNTGKEKMLVNILDPNREVAPPYIAFQVDTKDGESLIGIIINDSSSNITVRQAFGKEDTILRSNVRRMLSQGQSLMPEGLEQGLSARDFACLLEYISTANAEK